MLDAATYTPRLKALYRDTIRAALKEEFGYKNIMQVPRLDKIVLNIGCGAEAVQSPSAVVLPALLAEQILHAPIQRNRVAVGAPFAARCNRLLGPTQPQRSVPQGLDLIAECGVIAATEYAR